MSEKQQSPELQAPKEVPKGDTPENPRAPAPKTQPWKALKELSQEPRTWEDMQFKMIDQDEVRLVDVYRVRAGS